jgi:tape measure domain-containing protein
MSDILASVSVVLGGEISGFRAAMADARKELRGLITFSEGLKDIGTSLTQYVSAPLALLGGASVAASAKLESLKNGLAAIAQQDLAKQGVTGLFAMRQAAADAGERVQALSVIAKAPGLGLETAEQADIRLRAVGTSAQQSAKEIKAFANAIATTGGGRTQFETVTTQLSQLTAKGKVLAQDLRPIIEAAPAVAAALQRLYGTVDSETISASLAKQGKNSADFVATLTDELAKLPQVTGGLKAIYENDLDALLVTGAKFGDGIAEAFNLKEVGQRFGDFVTRLGDGFASLSPAVKGLVVGLGTLAVAVGPVLVAVGTLGAALPAITAGFEVLGVSSLAALGPILPAAAAVAAAAYVIYENWSDITAYFSSGEGASLFSDLAGAASSAASAIGEAFATIRANVGSNLGDMVSAATVFRTIFREAAVGVAAALNTVAGAVTALNGLLTGDFRQAADGASQAFYGLIDPIANLLGFTVRVEEANPILALRKSATEFNAVFPQLRANLDALNNVQLGPLGTGSTDGVKAQIGLLAALKARLKEVQDQRDKETNVAAISADNALIISLQKQIAALEGTDKASNKAAEALAKLRQELARLTALDNFLGDAPTEIQVLERRAGALQTGLKSLVDAGVSTSSRAFQDFARQLVSVSQEFDKLQISSKLDLKPVNVKSLVPQTIGDTLPKDVARLLGDYAKQQKPFELPVAVKLHMQATLSAPDFQQKIAGALLDISNGFQLADNSLTVFGNGFDAAGAKVNAMGSALQNLLAQGISPLNPMVAELGRQFKVMSDLANINTAATGALTSGLTNLATGLLEGLGQLASGTATLGDFGATMLGLVGKLATQLGEAIVAVGVGMLSLKTAFTNPFSAIAAGAALIVVGAALGSIASGLGSVGGGKGGASGAAVSAPSNYGQNSNGQQTVKVVAEFKLRGPDLVAIGRTEDYRIKRTG